MMTRSALSVSKQYIYMLGVGFLTTLMFFLCACSSTSTLLPTTSTAPIKIGISLSLNGSFSSDGQLTQTGYQDWAHDVNQNGGLLGRPVQLVILNDKSDPKITAANYQTLITKDKVDLVMGPFADDYTVAGGQVAKDHGYAMIDGTGNSPSTYEKGLSNVFCVSLPANDYLVAFAQYLLSLPSGIRPTTVAYGTSDDPFTQPQVDTAKQLLDVGGVKTLVYTTYGAQSATAKDYSAAALKIVKSGAQAVVLGTGGPTDYSTYIKVFTKQHYNPKIMIGTAGPDGGAVFVNAVGMKNTEGQLVPNGGWWPTINTYGNQQFVASYTQQFKVTPDAIPSDAVQAYSVGQVLQQAVTKLNSLNNTKLIAELASGDTFATLQGPVSFDSVGHNTVATAFLFQWQKGQLIPVYPDTQSQANLEYPKPSWS